MYVSGNYNSAHQAAGMPEGEKSLGITLVFTEEIISRVHIIPISRIYLSYYRYVTINFEQVVNFEKKVHNLHGNLYTLLMPLVC